MPQAISAAHALAQHLLAYEATQGALADPAGDAAIRTCAHLRDVVARIAGVAGFHALLARALTLAQREIPWLAAVSVTAEGVLVGFSEAAQAQDAAAATAGSQVLLTHLLGLLHTFIGEALTRRLVEDGWPALPVNPPPPSSAQEIDR
jgi:hypothetical protein